MNGESEKTWGRRHSRNEVLETVSYLISPVVPITLKTYTQPTSILEIVRSAFGYKFENSFDSPPRRTT